MDYDALNRAQRRVYEETLTGTHHREVELMLRRRRDGRPVCSLTNRFLGGTIQGDEDRAPVTFLDADVLDDDHALDWAQGGHRRFEVVITDSRFVPDLDDWVSRVTFTGMLWDFERTGPVVALTAEGPEIYAMGSVRNDEESRGDWPARTLAHRVVRELLRAAGAQPRDLRIPALKATLPRDVTVGVKRGRKGGKKDREERRGPKRRVLRVDREATYWDTAEPIAEAIDRDLYGDGAGRFVLAPAPSRPTLEVTTSMLTSPVVEKPGVDGEATNTWVAVGADPKGPRDRVRAEVGLPRRHPLSAWSMRWNGAPREVTERIENEQLRTNAAARKVVERRRARAMRERLEHEADLLAVTGWLRAGQLVTLPVASGRASTRVRRWTIGLGPNDGGVTVGANRMKGWKR